MTSVHHQYNISTTSVQHDANLENLFSDHDFYSTLYNNQAFDHSGDTNSRKGAGSHTGSGVVYVYDGTTGQSGNIHNFFEQI